MWTQFSNQDCIVHMALFYYLPSPNSHFYVSLFEYVLVKDKFYDTTA